MCLFIYLFSGRAAPRQFKGTDQPFAPAPTSLRLTAGWRLGWLRNTSNYL